MPTANGTIPPAPSALDTMVNIDGTDVRLGDLFPDEKTALDVQTKIGLLKKQPAAIPMDQRVQSGAPGGGEPDGMDPVMAKLFGGM